MKNDPDAVRNVWTKGVPPGSLFDEHGICNKCRGHGEVWRGYPPRLTCDVCSGKGKL